MIEDELLIEGVRRAADVAGTMGATARMVSDELRMDSLDVIAGLHRLERNELLEGSSPGGTARWYGIPETEEERHARMDREWRDEMLFGDGI